MIKDDKINIKLEVCKDKTSGKLSIKAHFKSDAPNIFKEKEDYFWMPTIEEKDFLNEAFQLMPLDAGNIPSGKTPAELDEIKEVPTITEPLFEEEIKTTPEIPPEEDKTIPPDLPPSEKPNELDVFEITDENIKTDDLVKDSNEKLDDISTKTDEQTTEEPKSNEPKIENKKEDEGIIVEADSNAIEAALKKHTEKDKSIVEADEQTIVDKVLSQKKKGKWSRR